LTFAKESTGFGSVFSDKFLARQRGLLRRVIGDLPGLTGVVLDISYPDSRLYAFSGTSRQAYIAKAGIDPLDLVGPRVLDSGVPSAPKEEIEALKEFLAWREARVLAFARECVQIVRESGLECGLLLDLLRYQQPLSRQRSSAQPWAEWLKELPDCRAVFSMYLLTSEKMPLAQEALRAIQTMNFKRPPAYLLGAYLSAEEREALGRALSKGNAEIIEVRR